MVLDVDLTWLTRCLVSLSIAYKIKKYVRSLIAIDVIVLVILSPFYIGRTSLGFFHF